MAAPGECTPARAIMVKIADGSEFKMPATIEDITSLDDISDALKTIGYAITVVISRNRHVCRLSA